MDEITKCYLNTISAKKNNILLQNKIKNKKSSIKKKLLDKSKNIILQQNQNLVIPGNTTSLTISNDKSNGKLDGGKTVEIVKQDKKVEGQITTDKKLVENLKQNTSQSTQLPKQQIEKLKEKNTGVLDQLQNGGVLVCDGFVYLIQGAGKIISWPFKAISSVLKPEVKPYVQPFKQFTSDMEKALSSNGKEATSEELAAAEKNSPQFYKALKEAPDGTILYDKITKKIYKKTNGKFIVAPYSMGLNNPVVATATVNATIKQATDKGISEGSGADAFKQQDAQEFLKNKQTAKIFQAGCKKLKLRDKKAQGNFLQMIQKMFAAMFGLTGNQQDDYQQYTDQQRMSFSPFTRKLVKNGLRTGTYKFEFK